MNGNLKYKGFEGTIRYSEEDECLIGEVLDMDAVVGYDGESVPEITAAFHEAVDDYLAYCESEGIEARKVYSGSYALRITPALHRSISLAAAREGVTLKAWIVEQLERGLHVEAKVRATEAMASHGGMTANDALEVAINGEVAEVLMMFEGMKERIDEMAASVKAKAEEAKRDAGVTA